ncbi:MAG: asparagine synthase (glutamine-hydrolyzing) [Bacteroidales bacterium]|nr:asparagine synthase (glutamine-hydrolyzing) [Bacteroidales bacterium]
MCGIVGIIKKNNVPVYDAELRQMCATIIHRGPDDEGVFSFGNVGIGMRRLKIIDLNTGHQPIHNENKTVWIVFNGEIYNYKELRKYLLSKGHAFYTSSDTEVILHLYEEKGADCLENLNGMFAFAIYDLNNKSLFMARDRLGIKPLFYCELSDKILFASEIKALLAFVDVPREINWKAFDAYFALGYVPAPLTIFKSIKKLPPAHYITFKDSSVTKRQYWDLYYQPNNNMQEQDAVQHFLELFNDAVKLQMVSEVPLGAFLSGGIDSSSVVAMMSRHNNQTVKTMSIGFGGEIGAYDDERKYARLVSDKFATDHHEHEIHSESCNAELIERIVTAFDEPFADHGAVPNFFVCQKGRQNMKVSLSGLGGDELFLGYPRHFGFYWSELYYKFCPGWLKGKILPGLVENLPESKGGEVYVNWLKRFIRSGALPAPSRYLNYFNLLGSYSRKALFSDDVWSQLEFQKYGPEFESYYLSDNAVDPLDKILYTDIKTYMVDDILTLTDRMSMYHSLEVRVPFLDHRLVEFCATIPSKLKMKQRKQKYLLRRAVENLIPKEVLEHKKQGFVAPMTLWLSNELKEYTNDILLGDSSLPEFFNQQKIAEILEHHYKGKQLNTALIWALVIFNAWQRKYL